MYLNTIPSCLILLTSPLIIFTLSVAMFLLALVVVSWTTWFGVCDLFCHDIFQYIDTDLRTLSLYHDWEIGDDGGFQIFDANSSCAFNSRSVYKLWTYLLFLAHDCFWVYRIFSWKRRIPRSLSSHGVDLGAHNGKKFEVCSDASKCRGGNVFFSTVFHDFSRHGRDFPVL